MLYLLVGIDTECDRQRVLETPVRARFENISALPRLHALFQKHRVRPTYLLTHRVASDERSASVLRELRQGRDCEMGAYHHAWDTPPCQEGSLERRPFALQLPQAQFAAQVRSLTEAVTQAVREPPLSYRSGRFGLSVSHVVDLERAGYRVDSSVVPLLYEGHRGGPDFVSAPPAPYFLAYDDLTKPGTSNLLELPVSAALKGRLPASALRLLAPVMRASVARQALHVLGLARVQWLQPSGFALDEMSALARRLKEDGVPTLNLVLNSSEIVPGGSQDAGTPFELERRLSRLEDLLTYIVNGLGAIPVTFSEFRALYCGTMRGSST
jgi:hypothetical protein